MASACRTPLHGPSGPAHWTVSCQFQSGWGRLPCGNLEARCHQQLGVQGDTSTGAEFSKVEALAFWFLDPVTPKEDCKALKTTTNMEVASFFDPAVGRGSVEMCP